MADEEDDKKTDTPPADPPHQDPPKADPPPTNDGPDRISKLEEVVAGLVEQVSLLAPDPHDSTPTKRPWLHRGGAR